MSRTKPTVLVVDDEPRNVELMQHMLATLDCTTVTAGSGRAALARFGEGGIDLVLLDVMMPELDGFDVLLHLRSRPQAEYVPVVLVTALSDRAARLRGLEAGADDFIEKPIDRPVLLARVRTLLRLRETQQALLERKLALEKLQQQQRELTQFIVHDLRSPLAGVQLSLSYLESALPNGGEWQEVTREALASARLASHLVMDLLNIALLEESALPLVRETIVVWDVLREVVGGLRREAEMRHVSLSIDVDPALRVHADRALLERSLWNLVSNALRYTPAEGRVLLSAHGGAETRLVVSNTGEPIPEEVRPRLFEKFVTRSVRSVRAGNLGLGLHFCKRVVAAHGGRISVEQQEGWPTSFVICLPTQPEARS